MGAEATLTTRVAGRDYLSAANADVLLDIDALSPDAARNLSATHVQRIPGKSNEQGEFVARFKPPGNGGYRVRARAIVGTSEGTDEGFFIVAADPVELRETPARKETLQALAEASRGAFHTLSDSLASLPRREAQVSRVNRRKDEPLWASGWCWPFSLPARSGTCGGAGGSRRAPFW